MNGTSVLNAPLERGTLEATVEQGADRLEEAAETLYQATKRFEKAEEAWDRTRLVELAKLYNDYDGKPPAADIRAGMVLELYGESEIYLEFVAAKAENEALDKRYRALAASVNARQSLLKRLS